MRNEGGGISILSTAFCSALAMFPMAQSFFLKCREDRAKSGNVLQSAIWLLRLFIFARRKKEKKLPGAHLPHRLSPTSSAQAPVDPRHSHNRADLPVRDHSLCSMSLVLHHVGIPLRLGSEELAKKSSWHLKNARLIWRPRCSSSPHSTAAGSGHFAL